MTETTPATDKAPKKRAGGLNSMLLADLKAMAGGIGITGAGSMKKAELVEAIKAVQTAHADEVARTAGNAGAAPAADPAPTTTTATTATTTATSTVRERPARARRAAGPPARSETSEQLPLPDPSEPSEPSEPAEPSGQSEPSRPGEQSAADQRDEAPDRPAKKQKPQQEPDQKPDHQADRKADHQADRKADRKAEQKSDQKSDQKQPGERPEQRPDQSGQSGHYQDDQGDGEGRTGRNRRRRGRDRNRAGQPDGQPGQAPPAGPSSPPSQGGQQGGQQGAGQPAARSSSRHEPDTTILEDDIVVPAAGILDVLDNYAFVRTSGYLAGPDDVYLSLSMVRKFGLRRGDAIVGQVRHPREGERREKFNPMVRIDSVNGQDPDTARTRAEFANLTPLSPSERLRLETGSADVIGRLVDLVAPIGKGQRGLVLSPPKAGRTTLLRSLAASVSANNPECHLMVVLVDERPEEVTDFERSVKGEVIASTFDHAPVDHITVAELAVERAKRLVELGHDVVLLLDGLTRLGRAYNLGLPPTGRLLSGVVDAGALHPTKRFFGAARNVENGGSLTIVATLAVDTGSATDQVLFEELRDTATMEVRLSGALADRQVFPAVDVRASGTRRDELFLGDQEAAITRRLRRSLADLETRDALEQLLERLRTSQGNIELLTQVQRTTPSGPAGQES